MKTFTFSKYELGSLNPIVQFVLVCPRAVSQLTEYPSLKAQLNAEDWNLEDNFGHNMPVLRKGEQRNAPLYE